MGKLFDALPPHYQVFVSEYVTHGKVGDSAKKSGSKAKNLSQAGKQLLKKAEINDALAEIKVELAESLAAKPERVLKEHARIGFSDIRNLFDDLGRLKPVSQIDDDLAAAISSVKVVARQTGGDDPLDVEYVHEIKLWNKGTALDALSKHLGLFEKDNEQKGDHTVILHDPTNPDAKEEPGEDGDS